MIPDFQNIQLFLEKGIFDFYCGFNKQINCVN